jgi:hypothetical protein
MHRGTQRHAKSFRAAHWLCDTDHHFKFGHCQIQLGPPWVGTGGYRRLGYRQAETKRPSTEAASRIRRKNQSVSEKAENCGGEDDTADGVDNIQAGLLTKVATTDHLAAAAAAAAVGIKAAGTASRSWFDSAWISFAVFRSVFIVSLQNDEGRNPLRARQCLARRNQRRSDWSHGVIRNGWSP